jgi:hypothetical protein
VTGSGGLAALELLAREVMPRFRGLPAVVPRALRDEVAATYRNPPDERRDTMAYLAILWGDDSDR